MIHIRLRMNAVSWCESRLNASRWFRVSIAVAAVSLFMHATPAAHAEDGNPLKPTPYKTPDEAVAHAKKILGTKNVYTSPPEPVDLSGAITKLEDGRIGFMPLLQHHMAVEHWFVTGIGNERVRKALAKPGSRCFVRVRGTCTLVGSFGSSHLKWYGNGLPHGEVHGDAHGGVMGYHERIYTLDVKEVVWVRNRNALMAARADLKRLRGEIDKTLAAAAYTKGLQLLEHAIKDCPDAGVDPDDLKHMRDHAARMVMLMKDPATWGEAEKKNAIAGLMRNPTKPFRELRRKGNQRFLNLIASWPESLRLELAPRAIKAWHALKYKHQLKNSFKLVSALGGPDVEAWKARVAEAAEKMKGAKETLKTLADSGNYKAIVELVESTRPYQKIDRSYAFSEKRLGFWLPGAKRLLALQRLEAKPKERVKLLLSQIDETVASGAGLPNENYKPRYNDELNRRVFPTLSKEDRAACEAALIEMGKKLNVVKDWKQVLLVAELLSGCGDKPAWAFFESLRAKTGGRPMWQRAFIKQFEKRLEERTVPVAPQSTTR